MPRTAREKSSVGLYHVLLRGSEGRIIFADDEDCSSFLDCLRRAGEGNSFLLYAYCLMGSHAHLLIRENAVPLNQAFKRIGASYAHYFNAKYHLSGKLFQDRFQSEAINDNAHFLDTMRFICQNPVQAGLSKTMFSYPWLGCSGVTESKKLLYSPEGMKEEKRRELVTFLRNPCEFEHLEVHGPGRLSDERAANQLLRIANCPITEISAMEKPRRDSILRTAHDSGLSIRQLSRLTGLGKTVVEHALK
ncbi:MAG: transposase [Oscillospiraceae bacterium]|nr:transposase [Oscillospiraceae bacterium]